MSSKQPSDVASELQFEGILPKISIPHVLGELDVLELADTCETGSELDHPEPSRIHGSEAIDNPEKIIVRENIDLTSINDDNAKLHHQKIPLNDVNHKRSSDIHQSVLNFEGSYRKIP